MERGRDTQPFSIAWKHAPIVKLVALAVVIFATQLPVHGQALSHEFVKNGSRFKRAFQPIVSKTRDSVVRVFNDEAEAALGVIVSAEGQVLTKASEVQGEVSIQLPDESEVKAQVIAVDREADLALLQADANNLQPVQWKDEPMLVGSWIASVGSGTLPVGVGIVGVMDRGIPAQRGMLGIHLGMDQQNGRPMVVDVYPESGAEHAGIQKGDVIISVAGSSVNDRDALLEKLAEYRPGESLSIGILRAEKKEDVRATLGNMDTILFNSDGRQQAMAGPLSVRNSGFRSVIQHDTYLHPHHCGSPIVNLNGDVVGLNIARAGRVETYSLPTKEILPILKRMQQQHASANKMTVRQQ